MWFRVAAQHLPAAHSEIIRPFAEWFIIRAARRRATRRRYTDKAAHTAAFIEWANKRGLTRNLEYPGHRRPAPATFLDDDDQADQLRRCLTDGSLPLGIRIAGALIRLYGLPITRIVHLNADLFHEDVQWAALAQDSWAGYLAALRTTE